MNETTSMSLDLLRVELGKLRDIVNNMATAKTGIEDTVRELEERVSVLEGRMDKAAEIVREMRNHEH